MKHKDTDEALGRTLGDLLLFAGGVFLFVSVLMHVTARADAEPNATTALVETLTGAVGWAPLLLFAAGVGLLGALDFLARGLVAVPRSLGGALGVATGVALLLGALTAGGGGALGDLLPGTLPRVVGGVLGGILGIALAGGAAWLAWLPGTSLPIGLSNSTKPDQTDPVAAVLSEEGGDGVSRAEADALLPDPDEASAAVDPNAFPSPMDDVRLRGGVPEGARPLDTGDPDDLLDPEPADGLHVPAAAEPQGAAPDAGGPGAGGSGGAGPAGVGAGEDLAAAQGAAAAGVAGGAGDDAVASADVAPAPAELSGVDEPPAPVWEAAGESEEERAERLAAVEAARRAAEADAGKGEEAPAEGAAEGSRFDQGGLFDAAGGEEAPQSEEDESEEVAAAELDEDAEGEGADDQDAEYDEDAEYDDEEGYDEEEDEADDEEDDEAEAAELEEEEEDDEEGEYEEEEPDEDEAAELEEEEPGEDASEAAELEEDEPETAEAAVDEAYELVPRPTDDEDLARRRLVHEAGLLILERDRVAVSMLQRSFDLDFDQATELLDELQELGLIGPYLGGTRRDILLGREEWQAMAPGG